MMKTVPRKGLILDQTMEKPYGYITKQTGKNLTDLDTTENIGTVISITRETIPKFKNL